MKKLYLSWLLCLIFMVACGNNGKKLTPLPVIYSVKEIQSDKEPVNQITANDQWADIVIDGECFSDYQSYDNPGNPANPVNEIEIKNSNGVAKTFFIQYVTETKMRFTIYPANDKLSSGTYNMRVKTPVSDWSNIMTVTIY